MIRFLLTVAVVFAVSLPAMAQDEAASDDATARRALAVQMNEIRPVREQVDEALAQMSAGFPNADQERFLKLVKDAFDYDTLERLSIDTMASLYTEAELRAMVDYYGSAAARSAAEKLPQYNEKLQPEIVRALDRALATERFGAVGK